MILVDDGADVDEDRVSSMPESADPRKIPNRVAPCQVTRGMLKSRERIADGCHPKKMIVLLNQEKQL